MNCGMIAEIIDYRGANDIDVKFVDETIILCKTYQNFINGKIRNPNVKIKNRGGKKKNYVGITSVSTQGQRMTIIASRTCKDIDVLFEDGYVAYNKSVANFIKGEILNPSYRELLKSRKKDNQFYEKDNVSYRNCSFHEFVLLDYLSQYGFYKLKHNPSNVLSGLELDLYNENLNGCKIGIEYDGFYIPNLNVGHTIERDTNKNSRCIENGIKLFRIRTLDCPILQDGNSVNITVKDASWLSDDFLKAMNKVIRKINKTTKSSIPLCEKFDSGTLFDKWENLRPISHIGEKSFHTSSNQYVTIIKYVNYHNITCRFDDGSEISGVNYTNFLSGSFAHPSRKSSALREQRMNNTYMSADGYEFKIIEYINVHDISICFEDGYRKKVYFADIKNLKVKHGKFRLGEIKMASNGQIMKLISYRNYYDVDVEFEDGTIVYNQSIQGFRLGHIKNPNYTYRQSKKHEIQQSYIGKQVLNKDGRNMILIDYRTANDITIEFDNGNKVKTTFDKFKKGQVYDVNYRIGEKSYSSQGQIMTIIRYKSSADIDIEFDDGTIREHVKYQMFKKGYIKNPNFKSTFVS